MKISCDTLYNNYIKYETQTPLTQTSIQALPPLSNDITVQFIIPFLSIKELSRLLRVSKVFGLLLKSESLTTLRLYEKSHPLRIPFYNNLKRKVSFHSWLLDCKDHCNLFRYSKELIALFGSIDNIFSMMLCLKNLKRMNCDEDLYEFTYTFTFRLLPPIFRIYYYKSQDLFDERFIIKYTLYSSKLHPICNYNHDSCRREEIWHNYIVFYLKKDSEKSEWNLSSFCSETGAAPLFESNKTKLDDENLKALVEGRTIIDESRNVRAAVLGHVSIDYFIKKRDTHAAEISF